MDFEQYQEYLKDYHKKVAAGEIKEGDFKPWVTKEEEKKGQLPEYVYGDSSLIKNSQVPQASTQLYNILDKQIRDAQDFRKNIPAYSDELYGNYASGARKQLAQNISDTKASFNRRGLFNSGARQGAEYGQQSATASDLANQRGQINQGLLSTAQGLENNAFNTAGNIAGQGPGLGAGALNGLATSIQQNQFDTNLQNALGGQISAGVGQLGGALIGGLKKPAQSPSVYNPSSNTGGKAGYVPAAPY